ncbi:MAG: hypothetical protein H0T89_03965 [Deltaproteobacteria bacterium]|nr:hypothetical protein [Deltaproteobacteria bacterium]MDQ3299366.1 hypothetical protein [Myxococcota bacterium]
MGLAIVGGVLCALALGCGASPPPPAPDFSTPGGAESPPPDPIACPEAELAGLATRIAGAQLTVSQEPIVDAARIDKLPCAPQASDEACLARARKRSIPDGYELTGVTIGGEVSHVEVTYDLDGVRRTEEAASLEVMVGKLKALQAKGHKVVLIAGHSVGEAETRHAAVAYRRLGGRQRRIATIRWQADDRARAFAEAQAAAQEAGLEIRKLELSGDVDDELVMTATCR